MVHVWRAFSGFSIGHAPGPFPLKSCSWSVDPSPARMADDPCVSDQPRLVHGRWAFCRLRGLDGRWSPSHRKGVHGPSVSFSRRPAMGPPPFPVQGLPMDSGPYSVKSILYGTWAFAPRIIVCASRTTTAGFMVGRPFAVRGFWMVRGNFSSKHNNSWFVGLLLFKDYL